MDIKKVLEAVARVVGEGAQQQYNVQTLGPDFREQIAKIKIAEEAARRAQELHGFEVGDQQAEAQDRTRVEDVRQVLSGGESADPVVQRMAALEDQKLTQDTESHEAKLRNVNADTAFKEARPDIEGQKLEMQLARLEQERARAETAAQAKQIDQNIQMLRLELMKRGQEGTQSRFEGRNQIDAGTRTTLSKLGSTYAQIQSVKSLMRNPKVQQEVGNLKGRINAEMLSKGIDPGFTTPEGRQLFVQVSRLFNESANMFGGLVLPPNEMERVGKVQAQMSDNFDLFWTKLLQSEDIAAKDIKRRVLYLGPEARQQARDSVAMDLGDQTANELIGAPVSTGVGIDGVPDAPRATPVPNAPGGNSAVDAFLKKYGVNP